MTFLTALWNHLSSLSKICITVFKWVSPFDDNDVPVEQKNAYDTQFIIQNRITLGVLKEYECMNMNFWLQ